MVSNVQKKKVERKELSMIGAAPDRVGKGKAGDLIMWEEVTPGRRLDVVPQARRPSRAEEQIRRRKKRRRRAYFYRAMAFSVVLLFLILVYIITSSIYRWFHKEKQEEYVPAMNSVTVENVDTPVEAKVEEPMMTVDLLEVNEYSRPGTALPEINNIFVHYTANPGTSAAQNRSYFSNLGETHERSASAHYIIGYEGEIIQCIPLDEQAYAVMTRNEDSISIECCYLDEDGKFTRETYDSLVNLLAWLTQECDLKSEDILRHYDCGGKKCPLYYVEHEDAWNKLLKDVDKVIRASAG